MKTDERTEERTYTLADVKEAFINGYFVGYIGGQWYDQHDDDAYDCETVYEDPHANRYWLEYLAHLEGRK